jgi:hypothetical protein
MGLDQPVRRVLPLLVVAAGRRGVEMRPIAVDEIFYRQRTFSHELPP